MYRLIAPALGSNDSKVKEESANLDALVLSRHNLPTDAGTTSWFNPASISSIILQTIRNQISKERLDIVTALAELKLHEHIPTPAERQSILLALHASEFYSSNFASLIQQTRDGLQQLEKEMTLDVVHLSALKWSVSALRRMPDEVLGEIFEILVLELKNTPWVLTRVSKKFRRVAFTTRRIWAKIRLDREGALGRWKWIAEREICTNVVELTTALTRSGKAPLDIMVEYCTEDMARLLAAEWLRWENFIYRETSPIISSILLNRSAQGRGLRLVQLRDTENAYFHRWLQVARPVSLKLWMCNIVEFDSIIWWTGLRELSVDFTSANICRHLSSRVLSSIMTTRHQLTRLELRDVPLDGDRMNNLVLPNLVELMLVNIPFWWNFRSDRLAKLTINSKAQIPSNTTVSYPSLLELDYESEYTCLHSAALSLPQLQTLTLRGVRDARPGHNFIWMKEDETPSNSVPRELIMINCFIPYKVLLDALSPYQTLESLHLDGTRLPLSFFKPFCIRPTSFVPIICPLLKNMVVNMRDVSGKIDESRFADVFEDIVATRKANGGNMSSLLITWHRKSTRPVQDFAKTPK